MTKPEIVNRYSCLGFWRHFAFVRWLYSDIIRLRARVADLERELGIPPYIKEKLTLDIKESNNKTVPVISESDNRDESFYQRRPNESIEIFLERIGTTEKKIQPEAKLVKSANDLIEDARKAHIKSYTDLSEDREKSKNIIVSDRAIDRIGNKL